MAHQSFYYYTQMYGLNRFNSFHIKYSASFLQFPYILLAPILSCSLFLHQRERERQLINASFAASVNCTKHWTSLPCCHERSSWFNQLRIEFYFFFQSNEKQTVLLRTNEERYFDRLLIYVLTWMFRCTSEILSYLSTCS